MGEVYRATDSSSAGAVASSSSPTLLARRRGAEPLHARGPGGGQALRRAEHRDVSTSRARGAARSSSWSTSAAARSRNGAQKDGAQEVGQSLRVARSRRGPLSMPPIATESSTATSSRRISCSTETGTSPRRGLRDRERRRARTPDDDRHRCSAPPAISRPSRRRASGRRPASDRYCARCGRLRAAQRAPSGLRERVDHRRAVAHVNAPCRPIAESARPAGGARHVFRQAHREDPAGVSRPASEFVAALRAGSRRPLWSHPLVCCTPPLRRRCRCSPLSTRRRARLQSLARPRRSAHARRGAGAICRNRCSRMRITVEAAPPAQPETGHGHQSGEHCPTTDTAPTTTPRRRRPASSSLSGSALNDAGFTKMQAGDYAGALPSAAASGRQAERRRLPERGLCQLQPRYTLLQLGRCARRCRI
jgi:hypothetical protein